MFSLLAGRYCFVHCESAEQALLVGQLLMSKKYNLGSDHEKYLEANFMSQSNLFLAFPFLLPDTSTASSATSTCSHSSSFIRPCRTGVLIVCWCQGFTEFPQLMQVLRRKQRRKLFCRSVFWYSHFLFVLFFCLA